MKVKGHRFATVIFRKRKLYLYLLMPLDSLNDPKQMFSKIDNMQERGAWNYLLEMRDESELDYVFEMLKQSYDLANNDI